MGCLTREWCQGGTLARRGGLQCPLLPLLVETHHNIVSLCDPIQVPTKDAQLVATQVANNKGGVRGWAIVHVAEYVMQVELLVIAPFVLGHLEVASAAPLLAAAMWLQLELWEVIQEASAPRGDNTACVQVGMPGVGWDASSIPIAGP